MVQKNLTEETGERQESWWVVCPEHREAQSLCLHLQLPKQLADAGGERRRRRVGVSKCISNMNGF